MARSLSHPLSTIGLPRSTERVNRSHRGCPPARPRRAERLLELDRQIGRVPVALQRVHQDMSAALTESGYPPAAVPNPPPSALESTGRVAARAAPLPGFLRGRAPQP